MVQMQSPIMDADLSPQAALYVAQLERNVIMGCINEAKFRALLELLTDTQWDDAQIDFWDNDALVGVAILNLQKKLNITVEVAADLVRERWDKYNKPVERTLGTEVDSVVPTKVLTAAEKFKDYRLRHPEKFPELEPPITAKDTATDTTVV